MNLPFKYSECFVLTQIWTHTGSEIYLTSSICSDNCLLFYNEWTRLINSQTVHLPLYKQEYAYAFGVPYS